MTYQIAPIHPLQDAAISTIIRTVGAEFGAIGEGFGPADAEVAAMSAHYEPAQRSLYLVATRNDEVVGGGGIAPFAEHTDICELRKLFLSSDGRGYGIGRALAEQCLNFAREQGYRYCYLDTLGTMTAAIALYERLGFERLERPLEGTVHGGCDIWMLKTL